MFPFIFIKYIWRDAQKLVTLFSSRRENWGKCFLLYFFYNCYILNQGNMLTVQKINTSKTTKNKAHSAQGLS